MLDLTEVSSGYGETQVLHGLIQPGASVQRGGKTLDRLQYGAGFGIAFGLFGTLLGIALARFLGAA